MDFAGGGAWLPDLSTGNLRIDSQDLGRRFTFNIFLDLGHVNLGASATSAVLHHSALLLLKATDGGFLNLLYGVS